MLKNMKNPLFKTNAQEQVQVYNTNCNGEIDVEVVKNHFCHN